MIDRTSDRNSAGPRKLPRRDWLTILLRTWSRTNNRDVPLVAAGVAFYILLGVVPALLAAVSIFGRLAPLGDFSREIRHFAGFLPLSWIAFIRKQLHALSAASSNHLDLGAIFGSIVAIYSAVRGMSGMMTALNIAYGDKEGRGFIRFYATALTLSLVAMLGGCLALVVAVGMSAFLRQFGLNTSSPVLALITESPILIALAVAMMTLLYRFGPDRPQPEWRWTSLGVVTGAVLWLAGTLALSVYASYFGAFKMYGPLSAPLILLTWLWLSVYLVLLGAEIDGEAEQMARQEAACL